MAASPLSTQAPKLGSEMALSSLEKSSLTTGRKVRQAARDGRLIDVTSGLAPQYLQANLIVLPSRYATDFRLLCARNPVPCPLIAESTDTGRWDAFKSYVSGIDGSDVLSDCDIRRDIPRYMVYKDCKPIKTSCLDARSEWTMDCLFEEVSLTWSIDARGLLLWSLIAHPSR